MDDDWRKPHKQLTKKIQRLFLSDILADVVINVTDGKTEKSFTAHSFVLKLASPVFERMLDGNFVERSHQINLVDLDPKVFESFLRAMYFDYAAIRSFEEAVDLLKVAHRFIFESLVKQCVSYMIHNTTPSNALSAFSLANLYQLQNLEEKAQQIMFNYTREFVSSKDFGKADEQFILYLLDERLLNISEFELFMSVEKWLKKRPDKKNLIDEIVSKFHFFDMSADEFAKGPCKSDLLTSEQKLAIEQNMQHQIFVPPLPEGITRTPRSQYSILSIPTILERPFVSPFSGVVFSVDQSIRIEELEVTNCKCSKMVLTKVKIWRKRRKGEISITRMPKIFKHNKCSFIKLENPITLTPGVDYFLRIFFDHVCNFKVARLDDVTYHQDDVNFHFSDARKDWIPILPLHSFHFFKKPAKEQSSMETEAQ